MFVKTLCSVLWSSLAHGILQGQLLLPQSRMCSLVSCLSLDVSSCILWSEKDKVFSSINKGRIIFMLSLLLQYSREGTLPWKLLVPQRPAKMSLDHGFLSLELGIKFTSGVNKNWLLEGFIRDISLVLYAWIRPENSLYYAFCTGLWFGLKSLCWPRVSTSVLQWLRGWFPRSKGLAVLGRDPHDQAELLQARACHVCGVLQPCSRFVLGATLGL